MSIARKIVSEYLETFVSKDENKMRTLLADRYVFSGPLMTLKGVNAAIEARKNFPFICKEINERIICSESTVVRKYDWFVTEPFKANIPMIEWYETQGQKIISCDLYFDTNKLPIAIRNNILKTSD